MRVVLILSSNSWRDSKSGYFPKAYSFKVDHTTYYLWTQAPQQNRQLCVLACTQKSLAQWRIHLQHINKACPGLCKEKNKGFSIFGVHHRSWWIELKWPGGKLISTLSCLPLRLSRQCLLVCKHLQFQILLLPRWSVGFWQRVIWQRWGNCQKRHPCRCWEDTLQRGKKKKKRKQQQHKTRNYQNSIQAQMWQLRAGPLRPLMMGSWLSICEEDPRWLYIVNTEWVSGFLPCLSQRSKGFHDSYYKSPLRKDYNEMSHTTALVQWVFRCF